MFSCSSDYLIFKKVCQNCVMASKNIHFMALVCQSWLKMIAVASPRAETDHFRKRAGAWSLKRNHTWQCEWQTWCTHYSSSAGHNSQTAQQEDRASRTSPISKKVVTDGRFEAVFFSLLVWSLTQLFNDPTGSQSVYHYEFTY